MKELRGFVMPEYADSYLQTLFELGRWLALAANDHDFNARAHDSIADLFDIIAWRAKQIYSEGVLIELTDEQAEKLETAKQQ